MRTVLAIAQVVVFASSIASPLSVLATDPTPAPSASEPQASGEAPAPSAPAPSATPAPSQADAPRPFVITFVPGTSAEAQLAVLAAAAVTSETSVRQLAMHGASLTTDQLAILQADTSVARLDLDRTRDTEADPTDTSYADQWSLPRIGWDQLHGSVAVAGTATVAVLDTGVDAAHPDLDGVVLSGTSLLDGSTGQADANGHGTWMAGIVAAETDNGAGVAGTAYAGVSILPVTVLGADGTGQDSDIIAGVVYAADAGADVILMSFSNPGYSSALQAAIDYAWASGAVLVAATGNDGVATATFPAGDRGVIGVTSTDAIDALAAGANHGAAAFMAAPGVDIVTTAAGGAVSHISGTSAAAASVAGAAALLKANEPFLSNGVIVGRLARNADPAGDPSQTGNGRLNLLRAMEDASTDAIQPAGAAPVADGGPFVGPYTAAATDFIVDPFTQNVASGSTNTFSWTFTAENAANVLTTSFTIPAGWTPPAAAAGPGEITVDAGTCGATLLGISGNIITIDQSPGTDRCRQDEDFTVNYLDATAPTPASPPQTHLFSSNHVIAANTPRVIVGLAANAAPLVAPTNTTLAVNEGQMAVNGGTWSDANAADTVGLTASVGTVIKSGSNAGGTWSWSYSTTDGPAQGQTVTITANDGNGGVTSTSFALTVANVAPTATFNAPASVDEGSLVSMSLTGASDASSVDQAAGFSYAFDCGTGYGSFSGIDSASCSTDDNGTRTVKGTIRDTDGGEREYTSTVTIDNVAPAATFNAPASVDEGSNIALSLSVPVDPSSVDAGSLEYAFDCGTGYGLFTGTASASCPTTDEGSRTVKGTIRDKDGGATEYSATVTILNVVPEVTAPEVDAAANQDASEGVSHSFVLGSFTDPGADSPWSIMVNWGDSLADEPLPDATSPGDIASAAHTYGDNGTYTVTVTVTDVDGGTDSDSFDVTVANTVPTAILAGDTVGEGSPGSVGFSFQDDPSEDDVDAGFRYSFSCVNDPDALATSYADADPSASTTCTFDDGPQNHVVLARIFDKDDGFTDHTTTVHVNNVTPTPSISGAPASSPEGTMVALTASATDASIADTTAGFTFAWSVTRNGNPYASGTGASFGFTPDDNGSYDVTLTATDKDAGAGTTTATIAVTNIAPTATFSAPASVDEGSTFTISLTSPLDPSSADTDAGLQYAFDCGSGTFGLFGGADNAVCETTQDGSLTVRAQIRDKDLEMTEYTATVTVANVAPAVAAGADAAIDEGGTFSQAGSFTDPGTDAWTATVDYGDGSGVGPLSLNPDKSFSLSHPYADDGSYTVTVVISDDDTSGSDTVLVTVANVAPSISLTGDAGVDEGATYSLTLGPVVDPGTDTVTAYAIDWGDGTVDARTAAEVAIAARVLTHVYPDGPDDHTIRVDLTDEDGIHDNATTLDVHVANVAPTVVFSGPSTVEESASAVSYGFLVTDPGADAFTISDLACGTGGSLVGPATPSPAGGTFDCLFNDGPASPVLSIEVTDDDAAIGTDAYAVSVTNALPVYVPPVISAAANQDATEGSAQAFDLGSFTDAGINDADWQISVAWGDSSGGSFDTATQGAIALQSHTYAQDGVYTVTVTVTDRDGGADTDTFSISVANVAPDVDAGPDAAIDEGGTFTSAGSFTDPGADTWTATVDYGDGSGQQALSLNPDKTFALGHVYAQDGVYTVTVTVSDDDTNGSDTVTVTVANVAPAVAAGADAAIDEGGTFSQAGSFTDPGTDAWTATVDYGDGSGVGPLSLNPDKSFSLSHPYADDGSYTVTVVISDDDTSGSDTVLVTVANVAPTVDAGSDATIDEGGTFTSSGSFTDPGADTWTATVDYGDGSGVQALTLNADQTFDLSHVYADSKPANAPYTVSVVVIDDDTGTGSDDVAVTVLNVAPTITIGTFSVDPISGIVSATASWSDPGADAETIVFTYFRGATEVGTRTFTSAANSGTAIETSPQTQIIPGCGPLTMTARVTDDDGLFGTDTETAATTDVHAALFGTPIKNNERNIAKYGNVVPVKVTLTSSCNASVTSTGATLFITLIKGSDMATEGTEIIPASVSAADSGNVMRLSGNGYMYNLTTNGLTQGSDYEIRIRVGATDGAIIAKAVLQPKK